MKKLFLIVCALLCGALARSQGRVVINEYMPWTSNGCGATAEFIELLNFGPGPIDIGCYILSDGDYSITIPGNTILQPGQFYVIAGQATIPYPCANIDSTIHADLVWTTCGCTSAAIPTTGDGFLTDGGSASEQLVLFKPDMTIADAVVRDLPGEPNSPIVSANTLSCSSRSFNMGNMTINYETLGMSAGRGNSFARKLDGDCGWVKDPQQSANATNNTPGTTSDISYYFSYDQSEDCTSAHGSISITVRHTSDVSAQFPMNWIIAYDSNNNGIWEFSDQYTEGIDSTPPTIYVDGLTVGRYRITLATAKGCGLKTFDFVILPCQGVLPIKLDYFNFNTTLNGKGIFSWKLSETADVTSMNLERMDANKGFVPVAVMGPGEASTGPQSYSTQLNAGQLEGQFRLKVLLKDGRLFYSQVINVNEKALGVSRHWPDPVKGLMQLSLSTDQDEVLSYQVFNQAGVSMLRGNLPVKKGITLTTLNMQSLAPGVYFFSAAGPNPLSFRFVKQ